MACPLLCMLLADMSSCLAFKALHCVMTVVILWCQRVNSLKKLLFLVVKLRFSRLWVVSKSLIIIAVEHFFWKVRAGSLQDLVYKGGQAGITKASVTLTFDNRDRKQSPLGYEQYEEITVTRQVRCTSVVACYQDWLGNFFRSICEWN